MSDNQLSVTVISPEKVLYTGAADYVKLPGSTGSFGVLINHAPLVSVLDIGVLEITLGNAKTKIYVDGGFAEVKSNKINVLTNAGELKENLNAEKVQKELDAAKNLTSKLKSQAIRKAKTKLTLLQN